MYFYFSVKILSHSDHSNQKRYSYHAIQDLKKRLYVIEFHHMNKLCCPQWLRCAIASKTLLFQCLIRLDFEGF